MTPRPPTLGPYPTTINLFHSRNCHNRRTQLLLQSETLTSKANDKRVKDAHSIAS